VSVFPANLVETQNSMFKIDHINIEGNVALSPMAAISDSPYRKICRRYGSMFSFSEFISADALVHGNKTTRDMLRYEVEERPVIIQIFGKNPDIIQEAALIVEQSGADIVDLNMGCSADRVAGGGAGAGLLKDISLAGRIIEAMKKAVKIPVSAKIRLGWDQNSKNYLETLKILEGSGVSMISVHGRTKKQAYTGTADWNAIGEIKSRASVPILGNGDVESYEDADNKIKEYGVDGVLIGRAAIGNPWVFRGSHRSRTHVDDVVDLVLMHLDEMLAFYPEQNGLKLFRKHAAKYMKHFFGAKEARMKLLTCESVEEFKDICLALKEGCWPDSEN